MKKFLILFLLIMSFAVVGCDGRDGTNGVDAVGFGPEVSFGPEVGVIELAGVEYLCIVGGETSFDETIKCEPLSTED